MNISNIITGILILCLPVAGLAADPGTTVRNSDLFSEPSYQAEKISILEKGSPLTVLKRQGGWYHVKANKSEQQGWVRMLSIRLGTADRKKGDSGITALSQFARTGQSGQVVATGVRGLSEEDIREARPDLQELEKMQGYQTSPARARTFARQNDLQAREVSYLEEPQKTSKPESNSFSFSD